ncbi:hypothetical protein [Bradyrhizobium glycinis]|uniref:hypothetical protein n=1 Tax=Bradyrhizobium glycinis TaxID=2751812 RepID=UPI0018D783A7|nr:hypothetical protein [Bradyrhizobium glycinis]MBH5370864.1 hypothetical protein [Bradyrhizobium glycinis]
MRGGARDVAYSSPASRFVTITTRQRDWAGSFIRVDARASNASQSARAEFLASLVQFVTFAMIGAAFPARMRRASARDRDLAVNTCGFLRISREFHRD